MLIVIPAIEEVEEKNKEDIVENKSEDKKNNVVTSKPITKSESNNTSTNSDTNTNKSTSTITNSSTNKSATTTSKDNKISINTASITELMTIKGIGEVKAKNIIEYREKNGLFKSIEDITKVSGIGSSTFEKIKTIYTVMGTFQWYTS